MTLPLMSRTSRQRGLVSNGVVMTSKCCMPLFVLELRGLCLQKESARCANCTDRFVNTMFRTSAEETQEVR